MESRATRSRSEDESRYKSRLIENEATVDEK